MQSQCKLLFWTMSAHALIESAAFMKILVAHIAANDPQLVACHGSDTAKVKPVWLGAKTQNCNGGPD